nr:glycerol-3-phosphate dehydrogenase [Gammaproteobacteria bacterium]
MSSDLPIAVIGAGSWGSALALHLARNGNAVKLWAYAPELVRQLLQTRINKDYIPDIVFPDAIEICESLEQSLLGVQDILIVVPSVGFRSVLLEIKQRVDVSKIRLVWGSKGLDPETGLRLDQVVEQVIGSDAVYAVLSGPSFAMEVARGMPTAVSLAGNDDAFLNDLIQRFHNS